METITITKAIISLLTLLNFSLTPATISELTTPPARSEISVTALSSASHQTDLEIHNGNTEYGDSVAPEYLEHCSNLAQAALATLPKEHSEQLKSLYFYYKPGAHRGYGNGQTIYLRCQSMNDAEFVGVLIHEMGHVVDLGLLSGSSQPSEFQDGSIPIYQDDKSLDFYRISWQYTETPKTHSSEPDFLSEYGMSSPFEDFAEAYTFYFLHGEEFRRLAQTNPQIAQKYQFLKTEVFQNQEYSSSQYQADQTDRPYDTTVLPYDLDLLLATAPLSLNN